MDTNDFLLGGGGTSARFDNVGDSITGTVESTEVKQQTDIGSGAPLTWDDGSPRMQLVVRLKTAQRDPEVEDDDGVRALYVKGSKKAGSRSLHDAVASAVRAAGAKGLEVGGTLSVTFTGEEASATRGFNPRKLYAATYAVPDKAAATGEYLGTAQQQPAQQAAPTVAQPAPAPQPAPQQPAPQQPAAQAGPSAEELAAFQAWKNGQQAS